MIASGSNVPTGIDRTVMTSIRESAVADDDEQTHGLSPGNRARRLCPGA